MVDAEESLDIGSEVEDEARDALDEDKVDAAIVMTSDDVEDFSAADGKASASANCTVMSCSDTSADDPVDLLSCSVTVDCTSLSKCSSHDVKSDVLDEDEVVVVIVMTFDDVEDFELARGKAATCTPSANCTVMSGPDTSDDDPNDSVS